MMMHWDPIWRRWVLRWPGGKVMCNGLDAALQRAKEIGYDVVLLQA